ncbi:MAG: hypothetical protein K0Q59_4381 [Paenibacillus sp.]|nr:hypothetical protein [Paenibacillus sp.]
MLKAGVARAVVNPPLTIEQGVWGAKLHTTPTGIEADFWATVLVLTDEQTCAVLIDLDLCTILNERAEAIRQRVAAELNIAKEQVRVSTTHTHAGPVLRADDQTSNRQAEECYIRLLIEQCAGCALQAFRLLTPVSAHAEYGLCSVGKNRRQLLEDGTRVAGYNESGSADPTVAVIRFDDEQGRLIASIVHYAAHPTTLGYTNTAASPDYPGVVKRFVERTAGGACLFLQGAAGDIGPGPGGFLDQLDVVSDIGTMVGCAAAQSLLEAKQKRYRYRFAEVVRSGADLGVWSRETLPLVPFPLQVLSTRVELPLQPQLPIEQAQQACDTLFAHLAQLKESGAPTERIREASFRLRRSQMALRRSKLYDGRTAFELEVHVIRVGDAVLIGIPVEPFSATGIRIRERSPFPYTLFSGYSNGANGYLPTAEAHAEGGYEVEQAAFAREAADLVEAHVIGILEQMWSR